MNEIIIYKKEGIVTNPKVAERFFNDLPDGKFLLTAKNIKKRSLPQNSYLHGVVIPLVYEGLKDAGFEDVRSHEDAKLIIKSLFLKEKVINHATGEMITEIIKDTHKLTTGEMVKFIDDVVMWAAQYLSITIPMPGEQTQILLATYSPELSTTLIEQA